MKQYSGILLIFLIACEPTIDHRGFNNEHASFSSLTVGKDTMSIVQEKIGSPTSISTFPDQEGFKSWYYITKTTSTTSFYKPTTLNQQTTILKFDKDDILRKIEKISGEKDIELNPQKTENNAKDQSLAKDIFGSFGVLNRKKNK